MSRVHLSEGSSRLFGDGDCSLHGGVRGAPIGVRSNIVEGH